MKVMFAAMTLGLAMMSCGGGVKVVSGKQGAAQAASALTSPTKPAAQRATATPNDLGDLTNSCLKGGSAKLSNFKVVVDLSNGTRVTQTYTMALANCGLASSTAGDALYNGSLEVSQVIVVNGAVVQVEQTLKGHVALDGAFTDFLDLDLTQSLDVQHLDTQGSVSMVLKGSVSNASGSYTFNESVTVNNGSIDVSATK